MTKYILSVLLYLLLPVLIVNGETDPITFTIKPELKQEGASYFLSVQGATNLPDKALFDITFTYRFPGSDSERYLDYKRCLVKSGAYQAQLGPLKRRPLAGQYLFKAVFDPERQPEKVSKQLSAKFSKVEYLSRTEILTIGASSEDAPKERRQMMAIIQKEGLTLKAIFDDIKGHYPKYYEALKPEDAKALVEWSKETVVKLESLVKSILVEDELRVFESVTQAKASIENSAFLLKSLLQKLDGVQTFKDNPIKDEAEYKRQLAILTDEVAGLYKLTEKEVLENLKDLGIFSLDKEALLAPLKRIETAIAGADEKELLKDADKAVIMREIVALSQNLPDMFYDELHQLVSELIVVMKGVDPIAKETKAGIIQKIKVLRGRIEEK